MVGIQEHQEFVHKIAESSLTLLINKGFFPSDSSKIGKVVNISIQKKKADQAAAIVSSKLANAFLGVKNFLVESDTSSETYKKALDAAKGADTVIISLFNQRNAYKDNGPLQERDFALVQKIIKIKPSSTVIMSYGNPYLAESLKKATAFVVGYGEGGFYGNQVVYADAFIRLLKGEISPQGKLPVKVSETFPIGSGIVY
jgi:beta-N-acetylhexosaminidase